jgi:thiol-disulfide isomerase/thioredoxin
VNRGDGTYLDVSGVSGVDFIGDGRGAVFADFDNDGDPDVFLRAMHGRAHVLFHNTMGQDGGFVRVALEGRDSGRDAFGATVRVKTSAGVLTKVKAGGAGFLSQADPRLIFGLGKDPAAEWIEVSWPSGARQRFAGPRSGDSMLLVEGASEARRVEEKRFQLPAPQEPGAVALSSVKLGKGDAFPALDLLALDGSAAPADALRAPDGERALVSFWATWCAACRQEMPRLQRLAAKGVRVIGVSLDDSTTRGRITAFTKELGVSYPLYVAGPGVASTVWRGQDASLPLTVLVGPDGRIEDVFTGWSRRTGEALARLGQ